MILDSHRYMSCVLWYRYGPRTITRACKGFGVSQTPKSIESKRRADKEWIKYIMVLFI